MFRIWVEKQGLRYWEDNDDLSILKLDVLNHSNLFPPRNHPKVIHAKCHRNTSSKMLNSCEWWQEHVGRTKKNTHLKESHSVTNSAYCMQWIYLPLYAFASSKNLLCKLYSLCSIRSTFPLVKSRLQLVNLSRNWQIIRQLNAYTYIYIESYVKKKKLIHFNFHSKPGIYILYFFSVIYAPMTCTAVKNHAVWALQSHISQLGSAQDPKFTW